MRVYRAHGLQYGKVKQGKYKYRLMDHYAVPEALRLYPFPGINHDYFSLSQGGKLVVQTGYCWDGPSGPTFDTKNFMRGSLVHDVLYQMMREKLLDYRKHRKYADKVLRRHCKEDGMSRIRASWVYWGCRLFGESSAKPRS